MSIESSSEEVFDGKKREVLSVAVSSYKEGLRLFEIGEFEDAEAHFVNVLRPFLSKPSMKSLYVGIEDFKEGILDSLYHLGLIYLEDAEKRFTDNYSKSASIFQYCDRFKKEYKPEGEVGDRDYLSKAYLCEASMLNHLGMHEFPDKSAEDAYVKSKLEEYISYNAEISGIREVVDTGLEDIKDFGIDEVSARSESVRLIYDMTSQFFASSNGEGLFQRLLKSAQELLGPSPCEFAVVGLGSLASGKMTPWSDVEFAIITENDEYKKDPKGAEYFRNLTKLLHIKTINLGESPVRSVGVDSLNNFKTGKEEDEWFWDDLVPFGVRFDSSQYAACKHPLGRQSGDLGGYKVTKNIEDKDTGLIRKVEELKPDFELIMTSDQYMEFQKIREGTSAQTGAEASSAGASSGEQIWFESDKHLVQALRKVSLIGGSSKASELLDEYRGKMDAYYKAHPELTRDRYLGILSEDVDHFQLKLGDKEEGKLLNIKESIYRVADRVIAALADYYNVKTSEGDTNLTSWEAIELMQERCILSEEGSSHLKEALSIAAELRLKTYLHNNGQSEGASTYVPATDHLTDERRDELLEETFYVKDTSLLHHFYQVMIKVQEIAKDLTKSSGDGEAGGGDLLLKDNPLLDLSLHTKGLIHARFLEYNMAVKSLEEAKKDNSKDLKLLGDLFSLYHKAGFIKESVSLAEEMLIIIKSQHAPESKNPLIAVIYNNLGEAYRNDGKYYDSISYFEASLEIFMQDTNINAHQLCMTITNLGNVYLKIGEYNKALELYNKSLTILSHVDKSDYEESVIMTNKGLALIEKGSFDQAIENQIILLDLLSRIYSSKPNHQDIALNLGILGMAYSASGKYDEAIDSYTKSLKIRLVTFSEKPSHSEISASYNNLGEAYRSKAEYDKAEFNHREALKMRLEIFIGDEFHTEIADSYNNLGLVFYYQGKFSEAEEYHKKALSIRQKIFAMNLENADIALSYNNLGMVYDSMGKYALSIENYIIALKIREKAFAQDPNHPEIASSHNNLGTVYCMSKNFELGLFHFEQALAIRKIAFSKIPHHPDIAISLGNIGNVLCKYKEYEQAIRNYNDALDIWKIVHKTTPNHPNIMNIYNNLGLAFLEKGNSLLQTGRNEEGVSYLLNALDSFLKSELSQQSHIQILICYRNLGLAYQNLFQDDKAIEFFIKAIELSSKPFIDTGNPTVHNMASSSQDAMELSLSSSKAKEIWEVTELTKKLPYKINYVFKSQLKYFQLKGSGEKSLVNLPMGNIIQADIIQNYTFVIPEGYNFGGLRISGNKIQTSCKFAKVQKITIGKLGDKSYIKVDREDGIEQKGIIIPQEGPKILGTDIPADKAVAFFNIKHPEEKIEFGGVVNFNAFQFAKERAGEEIPSWPSHFDVSSDMRLSGDNIVELEY